MIYLLSDGWHDSYSVDVLEGPEVANWQDLCISLIDRSVTDLLDENENFVEPDTRNMTDEEFDKVALYPTHICMQSVKEKVLEKLSDLGYSVLKPDNVLFYGTLNIYDKESGTISHAELMNNKDLIYIEPICKLESVLQEKTRERLLSHIIAQNTKDNCCE